MERDVDENTRLPPKYQIFELSFGNDLPIVEMAKMYLIHAHLPILSRHDGSQMNLLNSLKPVQIYDLLYCVK